MAAVNLKANYQQSGLATACNVEFPKPGVSRMECKDFMRRNVKGLANYNSLRSEIWPLLPGLNLENSELDGLLRYGRKAQQKSFNVGNKLGSISVLKTRVAERCSVIMKERAPDVSALDIKKQVGLIIELLNKQFHFPEVGLVVPLTTIVLQTIQDFNLALVLVWDLVEKSSTYLPYRHLSMDSYHLFLHAFKENLSNIMPRTAAKLTEIGALKRPFLDEFFVHFFYRILPVEDVRRMLDCYLIEGWKVLMRYAVAIFMLHKKSIKVGRLIPGEVARVPFTTGEELWAYLRACRHQPMLYNELFGLKLVKQVYQEPRIENWFKVLHVPRATLFGLIDQRLEQLTELSPEEKLENSVPIQLDDYLLSSVDIEEALTESGKEKGKGAGRNLLLTMQQSISMGPMVSNLLAESGILTRESAFILAPHIPETAHIEEFRRVYSSMQHGNSLDTLYSMTAGLSPCLVLIQGFSAINKEVVPIVGAYLTESVAPHGYMLTSSGAKSHRCDVRGSPQCFCFRLNGDHAGVFSPVIPEGIDSGSILHGLKGEINSREFTLTQYFSSNTQDGIIVGGSSKYSSNALRVDIELNSCSSGPSDTYCNEASLIPEFCTGSNVTASMLISNIEVLCGKNSVDTAIRTGKLMLSADENKIELRRDRW